MALTPRENEVPKTKVTPKTAPSATVQAGVPGSDPQAVEFDMDPEVKKQLVERRHYVPVDPEAATQTTGPSEIPRELVDPGVGHKPINTIAPPETAPEATSKR